MDPEDKLRVKQDPRAALQQPEFIRAVAAKTHMPRDTVRQLQQLPRAASLQGTTHAA